VRPSFHLVPAETWSASDRTAPYRDRSLADDGFIHLTDGSEELIATANRHFRDDPRPFVVLTIDLDRAGSPWRVEDARGVYPHVFGPIAQEAILGVSWMRRAPDGEFLGIGQRAES
jgi:uncharacterized protein (DUF952 family)